MYASEQMPRASVGSQQIHQIPLIWILVDWIKTGSVFSQWYVYIVLYALQNALDFIDIYCITVLCCVLNAYISEQQNGTGKAEHYTY